MASTRFLRYLAPNVITLASMIFGLVSLWSSHRGNYSLAGWLIIYAVLTDRMDGIVARAVKGTSELGMQLDSFADFLNFGVAPAFLVLTFLSQRPDLPYHEHGTEYTLLFVACGAYMLCAVFRLARYNVLSDDQVPTKMFFGFPTTLSGGMLVMWMLLFMKYDPTIPAFGGARLFGDSFVTPLWVWKYLPIALVVMGYLMASRLPMLKIGMTKNKAVSAVLFVLLLVGYICGFTMRYPELCFWMPTTWSIVFLIWGQASAEWRAMYPPPLFPKRPAETEQPRLRPQGDIQALGPAGSADSANSASSAASAGSSGSSGSSGSAGSAKSE